MRLHDRGETLFHPGAMSGGIAINSWINRGERIYPLRIVTSRRVPFRIETRPPLPFASLARFVNVVVNPRLV